MTVKRWLACSILMLALATPTAWGQANGGAHPVVPGRMEYDTSHPPDNKPLGEATPLRWAISLTAIGLLTGGVILAARRPRN